MRSRFAGILRIARPHCEDDRKRLRLLRDLHGIEPPENGDPFPSFQQFIGQPAALPGPRLQIQIDATSLGSSGGSIHGHSNISSACRITGSAFGKLAAISRRVLGWEPRWRSHLRNAS